MSKSASVVLTVLFVAVGVLFMTAGPAAASKNCSLNISSFKNGRVTKVSCKKAKKVVKVWWRDGKQVCFTATGCKVQGFRCSMTWVGYIGRGKCTAPKGRKITFTRQ